MSRDDACLLDMKLASEKALSFTRGATRDAFAADEMMQFAVASSMITCEWTSTLYGESSNSTSPSSFGSSRR